LLDEDVEDAAAGQAHRERVIVTEAVPLQHRLATLSDLGGKLVDRALDAAARDGADHLAAVVSRGRRHRERRPWIAWRATERADHRRQAERLVVGPPLGDRVQDVAHSLYPEISLVLARYRVPGQRAMAP
jgi:hypothetical protein